jgi:hypothetical protein
MKSLSVISLFIILIIQLKGQNISGKVIDSSNDEPLVYVSIGVMETIKGTKTDENGDFNLDITNLCRSEFAIQHQYIFGNSELKYRKHQKRCLISSLYPELSRHLFQYLRFYFTFVA